MHTWYMIYIWYIRVHTWYLHKKSAPVWLEKTLNSFQKSKTLALSLYKLPSKRFE